ncbi:hypothetical protein MSP8887_01520 [Marinomonas spartinae]|uniref:Uncharacterized protein n=1 Tax=Marinomonas spartinae TaxID=1792290 RepID=A0A1A8TWE1_9GAMM|nr:hypothetical protein [Marinomonas spartinae]SBS31452.1 hypothetical protein MSP8887_01520 [Marinomonas spartinae]SBS37848.1 hypothetical protein MSP8886_04288 [Marinomonas spartinae]
MSVSSVSYNDWSKILPTAPASAALANNSSGQHPAQSRESLHLSTKAQLISQQLQAKTDKEEAPKTESIQVTSSVGKSASASGLTRNEAIAMYRSIESIL